jgi:hypothetical protein
MLIELHRVYKVDLRQPPTVALVLPRALRGRLLGTALELSSVVDAEAADSAAATEHGVQGRRRRGEEEGVQEGWGRGWVGVRPLQDRGRPRDNEVLRAVPPRVVLQRGMPETALERRRAQSSVWAGRQRFPTVW